MQTTRKPSALRLTVLGLGIVMLVAALHLWFEHDTGGAWIVLGIYGAFFAVGVLIERSSYKPNVDLGARGWKPTEEKFIDPVTGELVQVWFNEKSGERDYRRIE
jgi:hypothetical protein